MHSRKEEQRFRPAPPTARGTSSSRRSRAHPSHPRGRDCAVAASTCALALGIAAGGLHLWQQAVPAGAMWLEPRSVDDVATVVALAAAALGLVLASCWLLAVVAAFLGALLLRLTGQRTGRGLTAVAPQFIQRLALTAVGLSLVTAPVAHADPLPPDGTPVAAATISPGWTSTATTEPPESAPEQLRTSPPSPAWQPARPAQQIDRLLGGTARTSAEEIVVQPGDSLWTITARALGSSASAAEVAEAWPHWYHANRDTIGPDPNLLIAGTTLQYPSKQTAAAIP
ncbi:LysM peptidoglycan-binding domain-containing protein [Zhihengliuella flava]|uniref:LysM domain-containing protein n=1 Tax=Zhihengliuella flava TaxID=1285193 RepID=A0A931DF30_9MICC|nr:hypothetical protein [Zhihengliuella flava]MBG6085613.1 hypothetical protein [Zhihengliuella flava]